MSMVLQVLGGLFVLFLVLIVGVVVLWQVIKSKLRKFAQGLAADAGTPSSIHLEPEPSPEWRDAGAVRRHRAPLESAGFQDAGVFSVAEMPGILLHAFAHPAEGAYAVVYEHPQVGVWLDLVTRYADGTSVTFGNATRGGGLDSQLGHDKVREPGGDPAALLRRFLAERAPKPRVAVSAAEFVSCFEQAYADEMQWRNERGGPTEEEIRRVAAESGREVCDETVAATREVLAARARESLAG